MRIAISGSHLVGKTTLAEALAEALPHHQVMPEPYRLLEEEGHEFGEMPSVEEFELQLERSFQCLEEGGQGTVFDRCPLDLVGYLLTHEDAEAFDLEPWLPRIRERIATLDLIVFVPIEEPDRMDVPRSQRSLRAEVDAVLSDIVLGDAYDLEVDTIEVAGSLDARLRQVLAKVRV
jgi:hypothetical protein